MAKAPKSVIYDLLKPGTSDGWEVRKVVIPEELGGFQFWTPEGMRRVHYTSPYRGVALIHEGDTWMSDSPKEITTSLPFIARAHGEVLEVGLGIGLTTTMLLRKPTVKKVVVCEKEPAVIGLVYDRVKRDGRTEVVNMAVEEMAKDERFSHRFDAIHFDIWLVYPTPEQIKGARELVAPMLKPDGFVYVWLEELMALVEAHRLKYGPVLGEEFKLDYPPCYCCGKRWRNDFMGLCMDCADLLGLSNLFLKKRVKAS